MAWSLVRARRSSSGMGKLCFAGDLGGCSDALAVLSLWLS